MACVLLTAMVLVSDLYLNVLPTTIQTRLPLHQPGMVIKDIKYVSCYLSTGCTTEGQEDGWVRLPKDTYLGSTWAKRGYITVQRVDERELENGDKVILDIALNDNAESEYPSRVKKDVLQHNDNTGPVTEKAVKNRGWTQRSDGHLWVRYGKYNVYNSVTDLEVLFGDGAREPRLGWTLLDGYIDSDAKSKPRLSIRLGQSKQNPSLKLKMNEDGKMKILQVADMHFSTLDGACRDTFGGKDPNCKADPRTLEFIERLIEKEKPGLVVMTGDQVFGDASPDTQTSLYKAVYPFVKHKIPYAMVFGNHDDEGNLGRKEIMDLVTQLPYSLAAAGPEEVPGVGNYVLSIESYKNKNNAGAVLYFLDSHKKHPNQKASPGYDWIKDEQLNYVSQAFDSVDSDGPDPLSIAFFHVPVPEYRDQLPMVGTQGEPPITPNFNSGVMKMLQALGVTVISVGHDHLNDYCKFAVDDRGDTDTSGMWLCYGGGIGEGGYAGGSNGFMRRARVFELDERTLSIFSWKRLNDDELTKIDHNTLVSDSFIARPVVN